ncbi:probable glycosyltransferase At3g42180 [Papaver somniferum]|uniref:probable glycosyltransferase At3g42180 n=1 Tax=Papaver somniferum TaxID=3469 RepID=UPI000E701BF0|nr:probable glycosyltransferase At3g42180 [Papaver somniferum]
MAEVVISCRTHLIILATFLLVLLTPYISPYDHHSIINTDFFSSSSLSSIMHKRPYVLSQRSYDSGILSVTSVVDGTHNAIHIREKLAGAEKIEDDLARARDAIRKAILTRNYTSNKAEDFIPTGTVYRNSYAFHQ